MHNLQITASLCLVLLLLMPMKSTATIEDCLFRRVTVSHSLVVQTAPTRKLETFVPIEPSSRRSLCSAACCGHAWCRLWCLKPDTDHCLLTNMFVTPRYVETNPGDAIICYTRRHPEYVTGAAIEATAVDTTIPVLREKENLVDGFYKVATINTCYKAIRAFPKPWIVLDLHQIVNITQVIMVPQHNVIPPGHMMEFEVRVGDQAVPSLGDFSSYTVFGQFPGPVTPNEEFIVSSNVPVSARFVSIQMMVNIEQPMLQMCHIEIY